ncbi:alpha/beta hydrolase-fold protein [Thermaurantimonas aggregans]|uniref:alpha/beta hydrolase-fold protein n=1 Tax=Thermaurantimonas aggregans TaxID=2173829 RepID=UPI0023F52916|nr:alpha/beta hydrolase-fold protein [Thermaurantimonas aggregans]MCX8148789.1 alpha/beta hydrolase-fold protein [Thermaurantimonas aggregans]
MKVFKFFGLFVSILIHISAEAQLHILVQQVPANTPPSASIYIAGNFNNWNPSDTSTILTKIGSQYFKTLTITTNLVQFKFTRGSWQTVEGNQNGGFLPNRVHNWSAGDTLKLTILSWEDLGGTNSTAASNVSIVSNAFFMPPLNRSRRIWIYLPPHYTTNTDSFPVLYMHDGQNLFDQATSFAGEWQVDETLNSLYNSMGKSIIVVGIDNGGAQRINEYSPWVNSQYGGGQGDQYMDFIVQYLKPYIDSAYRTQKSRNSTGMMGSSMGGLITYYGGLRNQETFSKLGIFSPSYWFSNQVWSYPASVGQKHPMRIYQLAGGLESNGSVAQQIAQMKQTLVAAGFAEQEIQNKVVPNGQHNEAFWRQEFGEAVLWLFADHYFMATNEISAAERISIFPNPFQDTIFIQIKDQGNYEIMVTDLLGRVYYLAHFSDQQLKNGLDLSWLKSGAYVIHIKSSSWNTSKVLIRN